MVKKFLRISIIWVNAVLITLSMNQVSHGSTHRLIDDDHLPPRQTAPVTPDCTCQLDPGTAGTPSQRLASFLPIVAGICDLINGFSSAANAEFNEESLWISIFLRTVGALSTIHAWSTFPPNIRKCFGPRCKIATRGLLDVIGTICLGVVASDCVASTCSQGHAESLFFTAAATSVMSGLTSTLANCLSSD
jgi:hypothetical protein